MKYFAFVVALFCTIFPFFSRASDDNHSITPDEQIQSEESGSLKAAKAPIDALKSCLATQFPKANQSNLDNAIDGFARFLLGLGKSSENSFSPQMLSEMLELSYIESKFNSKQVTDDSGKSYRSINEIPQDSLSHITNFGISNLSPDRFSLRSKNTLISFLKTFGLKIPSGLENAKNLSEVIQFYPSSNVISKVNISQRCGANSEQSSALGEQFKSFDLISHKIRLVSQMNRNNRLASLKEDGKQAVIQLGNIIANCPRLNFEMMADVFRRGDQKKYYGTLRNLEKESKSLGGFCLEEIQNIKPHSETKAAQTKTIAQTDVPIIKSSDDTTAPPKTSSPSLESKSETSDSPTVSSATKDTAFRSPQDENNETSAFKDTPDTVSADNDLGAPQGPSREALPQTTLPAVQADKAEHSEEQRDQKYKEAVQSLAANSKYKDLDLAKPETFEKAINDENFNASDLMALTSKKGAKFDTEILKYSALLPQNIDQFRPAFPPGSMENLGQLAMGLSTDNIADGKKEEAQKLFNDGCNKVKQFFENYKKNTLEPIVVQLESHPSAKNKALSEAYKKMLNEADQMKNFINSLQATPEKIKKMAIAEKGNKDFDSIKAFQEEINNLTTPLSQDIELSQESLKTLNKADNDFAQLIKHEADNLEQKKQSEEKALEPMAVAAPSLDIKAETIQTLLNETSGPDKFPDFKKLYENKQDPQKGTISSDKITLKLAQLKLFEQSKKDQKQLTSDLQNKIAASEKFLQGLLEANAFQERTIVLEKMLSDPKFKGYRDLKELEALAKERADVVELVKKYSTGKVNQEYKLNLEDKAISLEYAISRIVKRSAMSLLFAQMSRNSDLTKKVIETENLPLNQRQAKLNSLFKELENDAEKKKEFERFVNEFRKSPPIYNTIDPNNPEYSEWGSDGDPRLKIIKPSELDNSLSPAQKLMQTAEGKKQAQISTSQAITRDEDFKREFINDDTITLDTFKKRFGGFPARTPNGILSLVSDTYKNSQDLKHLMQLEIYDNSIQAAFPEKDVSKQKDRIKEIKGGLNELEKYTRQRDWAVQSAQEEATKNQKTFDPKTVKYPDPPKFLSMSLEEKKKLMTMLESFVKREDIQDNKNFTRMRRVLSLLQEEIKKSEPPSPAPEKK